MMKDTTSLVTRNESFIKITNKHPRASNVMTDVCEVGPKVRVHDVIGASIDTCACGVSVSPLDREGYGILILMKDG